MNIERENLVFIPANTEITFCNKATATNGQQTNSFGLNIIKKTYYNPTALYFNQLSTSWLLFNPCERLKMSRDIQDDSKIPFHNHRITLAFGALISPYQFKCAGSQFLYRGIDGSLCKLFFARNNSHLDVNIGYSRFSLKREHIDYHRGVIIEYKPNFNIIVHICLRGNLDEYILQDGMSTNKKQHVIARFLFLPM